MQYLSLKTFNFKYIWGKEPWYINCMKLECIQFSCFNFFFPPAVCIKKIASALSYCIFFGVLLNCAVYGCCQFISSWSTPCHCQCYGACYVIWGKKFLWSLGWGRDKSQSKTMLKSVLKLRRSTEYMLSAEHSYSPASICVAGSISSFDFTLSGPIFHSWTCKPRYSLQ